MFIPSFGGERLAGKEKEKKSQSCRPNGPHCRRKQQKDNTRAKNPKTEYHGDVFFPWGGGSVHRVIREILFLEVDL